MQIKKNKQPYQSCNTNLGTLHGVSYMNMAHMLYML